MSAERITDLILAMPDQIDLIYVDRGDCLADSQIASLVRGDLEAFWDSLAEWESEALWEGRQIALDCILRDEGLAPEDFTSDELEELLWALSDRESGAWVRELVNGSGTVLLRVPVMDEDNAAGENDTATAVLDKIGAVHSDANHDAVQYALDNVCTSVVMGFLVASVSVGDVWDLDCEDAADVEIVNPYVFLGNPFSGAGFLTEEPITGVWRVKRGDLRTDADAFGYGITDIYGGLPILRDSVIRNIPSEVSQ